MTLRGLTHRRIFIDTSAFFALASLRDPDHRNAQAIRRQLIRESALLFTTNFVLAETHALLLARVNRRVALETIVAIQSGRVIVIRATPDDERDALGILRQYDDKDFSFTDALSFVIATREAIDAAFTYDSDFAQYGLPVLQP